MKRGFSFFILFVFVALTRVMPQAPGTVKIGMLVPEEKSKSARQGAELAVYEANAKGGYQGQPFRLVVRSMEGPWGTGSKEAVNLIFDDEVTAIIGSHDGRNAHLVEQVTTKTRIVFLSAWASDPTLSQAFVPWYYSCVPNDLQQADALIQTVYSKTPDVRIAALFLDDYDSRFSLESFVKRAGASGKPEPLRLLYNPASRNESALLDRISKAGINCILLFGKESLFRKLIHQINMRKLKLSIYGSLSWLGDDQSTEAIDPAINVIRIPAGNWPSAKFSAFSKAYRVKYGTAPNALASYAYDGMNVLIQAIKNAGTEREDIQKYLSVLHFEGVTGSIRFDSKGNRTGIPEVMKILNGLPETVTAD